MCMAPEMELSMRVCRAIALCGNAWQDEAKPRGGGGYLDWIPNRQHLGVDPVATGLAAGAHFLPKILHFLTLHSFFGSD